MAETNGLLNRRTGKSGTEGSNPSVSATPAAACVSHSPEDIESTLICRHRCSHTFAAIHPNPRLMLGSMLGSRSGGRPDRRGHRLRQPSSSTSMDSTIPAAAIHIWAALARSRSKPRWHGDIADRPKAVTSPMRSTPRWRCASEFIPALEQCGQRQSGQSGEFGIEIGGGHRPAAPCISSAAPARPARSSRCGRAGRSAGHMPSVNRPPHTWRDQKDSTLDL